MGEIVTGVFINYRTDDGGQSAGPLALRLRDEFGDDMVFLDSAALEPGIDFPRETLRRLDLSTVLLALIGPGWLGARDAAGGLRLAHPQDFLRREIEISLERRIHVIPILLGDAQLPAKHDLPLSIADLADRQAMRLRSRGYETDLELVIDAVAKHVPRLSRDAPAAAESGIVYIRGDGHKFEGPITGFSHGR